jgi:hypothetical protein
MAGTSDSSLRWARTRAATEATPHTSKYGTRAIDTDRTPATAMSTTPERREKRRSLLAGTSRPCSTWIMRNSSANGTWASAKLAPARGPIEPTNQPSTRKTHTATITLSQKPSRYRVRHEYQ